MKKYNKLISYAFFILAICFLLVAFENYITNNRLLLHLNLFRAVFFAVLGKVIPDIINSVETYYVLTPIASQAYREGRLKQIETCHILHEGILTSCCKYINSNDYKTKCIIIDKNLKRKGKFIKQKWIAIYEH